jgi:Tol biopolymer transport system component/DNA-binding winged helix-turn-helix (wHTH) protein
MDRTASSSYFFGPFELDPAEQRLLRGGHPVPLTPKLFELLRILVANAGRLVLKDDLVRQLWPDTHVEAANLSRAISVLRATLQENDGARFIETVPKRGYRFVAEVRQPAPPAQPGQDAAPRPGRTPLWLKAAAGFGGVLVLTISYSLLLSTPLMRPDQGRLAGVPLHRQLTSTGREGTPSIAPDGRSVAYVSMASPENLLVVQDLPAGQSVIAFRAPEINNIRWSPDGEQLLFFARGGDIRGGIFVVSRSGGAPRKIVDGLFKACWSPDGSRVAVGVFMRGAILLVDRHGKKDVLALEGPHRWVWDIDWSSAADRLLLLSDDDRGNHRLWTIRPDGTNQRLVHEERVELRGARWTPDGRAIVFSRRDDQTTSFFKVNASGVRPTAPVALPLLSGLETSGAFTVSSDGRRLVYARAPYHSNLWAIHLRGRPGEAVVPRQLTSGTTLVERPRISPDGQSVVFNRGYDGRANLFVMPVAGGSARQLTFLNGLSLGGMWSPDGRQLVFASNEGGPPRAWVIAAEGGPARPVSDAMVSDSYAVTWSSPAQVLYQTTDNQDFAVVDVTTTRDTGRLLGGDAELGWIFSPELAPDGRRLAAGWNQRGRHGLWVFDPATGRRTLVLEDNVLPIGWAADGRSVFAVKAEPGVHRGLSALLGESIRAARVIDVPIDGRPVRDVLLLPFEEVGGVSISADGRTIVCAVYSSRSDIWVVEDFDASSGSVARGLAGSR